MARKFVRANTEKDKNQFWEIAGVTDLSERRRNEVEQSDVSTKDKCYKVKFDLWKHLKKLG